MRIVLRVNTQKSAGDGDGESFAFAFAFARARAFALPCIMPCVCARARVRECFFLFLVEWTAADDRFGGAWLIGLSVTRCSARALLRSSGSKHIG